MKTEGLDQPVLKHSDFSIRSVIRSFFMQTQSYLFAEIVLNFRQLYARMYIRLRSACSQTLFIISIRISTLEFNDFYRNQLMCFKSFRLITSCL